MNQTMQLKPKHLEMVANHLLSGRTITQAQFCDMISKSSRLAPRILDLKKLGYPVAKNMIALDDGTHVAEYYLTSEFLQNVDDYGLELALTYSDIQNLINKEMERLG